MRRRAELAIAAGGLHGSIGHDGVQGHEADAEATVDAAHAGGTTRRTDPAARRGGDPEATGARVARFGGWPQLPCHLSPPPQVLPVRWSS
jgi:hypothetical protein